MSIISVAPVASGQPPLGISRLRTQSFSVSLSIFFFFCFFLRSLEASGTLTSFTLSVVLLVPTKDFFGCARRVKPSRACLRAHVRLSTADTGSALYERYCEREFGEFKMAVAWFHWYTGLSGLPFLKSVKAFPFIQQDLSIVTAMPSNTLLGLGRHRTRS